MSIYLFVIDNEFILTNDKAKSQLSKSENWASHNFSNYFSKLNLTGYTFCPLAPSQGMTQGQL